MARRTLPPRRAARVLPVLGFLALLLLGACGRVPCSGDYCPCVGRDECIIACERDGCDLECSNVANTCGAVCEDDCEFACHDTNHCSSFSGDDSVIDCRGVASCAGECGARCQYFATSVSEIHVTVGPGSSVDCSNMAHCDVFCIGDCEVTCSSVSRCDVDCEDGTASAGPGSGTVICD